MRRTFAIRSPSEISLASAIQHCLPQALFDLILRVVEGRSQIRPLRLEMVTLKEPDISKSFRSTFAAAFQMLRKLPRVIELRFGIHLRELLVGHAARRRAAIEPFLQLLRPQRPRRAAGCSSAFPIDYGADLPRDFGIDVLRKLGGEQRRDRCRVAVVAVADRIVRRCCGPRHVSVPCPVA